MYHQCTQCGGWSGYWGQPAPDDCPHCGHPIRWAHRTDGKNLRARFDAMKRAEQRYPDPPPKGTHE